MRPQQYSQAFMGQDSNETRYDMKFNGLNNNYSPYILTIDSKDRNTQLYPNQNKYKVKLDPDYKEVVSLELVQAIIPKSLYNINNNNNTLKWYLSSNDTQEYFMNLAPGNYTTSDLLSAVQSQMESAAQIFLNSDVSIGTSINPITQIVSINVSDNALTNPIFQLNVSATDYTSEGVGHSIYDSNTLGRILGFPATNQIETGVNTTLTGTYPLNFNHTSYISLHIKNINVGHIHSNNQSLKNAFAVFPLEYDQPSFTYKKESHNINPAYIKEFSQPLRDLKQLEFEWRDDRGNLYDFNNQEHLLVFEIKSNTKLNKFLE
jgi:hypothetical protein